MKSVNKVTLLGNAYRDASPYEYEGFPACTFGIATNRTYTDPDGESSSLPEFSVINVVGPLVSVCLTLVKKGKPIYVEGYLRTEDGITRIMAEEVVFIGSSARAGG